MISLLLEDPFRDDPLPIVSSLGKTYCFCTLPNFKFLKRYHAKGGMCDIPYMCLKRSQNWVGLRRLSMVLLRYPDLQFPKNVFCVISDVHKKCKKSDTQTDGHLDLCLCFEKAIIGMFDL